jgi:hypothetical protein
VPRCASGGWGTRLTERFLCWAAMHPWLSGFLSSSRRTRAPLPHFPISAAQQDANSFVSKQLQSPLASCSLLANRRPADLLPQHLADSAACPPPGGRRRAHAHSGALVHRALDGASQRRPGGTLSRRRARLNSAFMLALALSGSGLAMLRAATRRRGAPPLRAVRRAFPSVSHSLLPPSLAYSLHRHA